MGYMGLERERGRDYELHGLEERERTPWGLVTCTNGSQEVGTRNVVFEQVEQGNCCSLLQVRCVDWVITRR